MSYLRSRQRWCAIVVTMMCSFWLAASANALPIGDYSVGAIDSQTSFTSSQLNFTNFQFYLPAGADPSAFTLHVLEDAVRLTGPMSVAGGALAEFYFSYEVSVLGNLSSITGVTLFAPSVVTGDGFPSFVKTSKQVYPGPTPEMYSQDTLLTLKTKNFEGYSELDSGSFAPQQLITVFDAARVQAAGAGDTATLLELTDRFNVVPEPTTLVLVGLGVLGLGIVNRRR